MLTSLFLCSSSGETDLIKKNEEEDIGLLSGTHVMEGSGRMVVVGVGLNSQVGNIMSLLGTTAESGKDAKDKAAKKAKKATKVSADLTKQSVKIEDETKLPTSVSTEESLPLRQSELTKDQTTTNGQGAVPKLAADEEEEENVPTDSKHKCKYQYKIGLTNHFGCFLSSLAVLQEKLTTLALYIGYIGKYFLLTRKRSFDFCFFLENRYECCSNDIGLFNLSILYHHLCYSKTQTIRKRCRLFHFVSHSSYYCRSRVRTRR